VVLPNGGAVMGFVLYILLNVTLFVRPTEIFPDLLGLPIYNLLSLGCLALTFPALVDRLRPAALAENPISACVVGIQVAVVLSHLAHGHLQYAREMGFEFFKVVLYYFTLVALVDSPARLRQFMTWVVVLVGLVSVLSLLNYHDLISLHGVEHLLRVEEDATTGEVYQVRQLQGSGIFGDPNDLCLILVTGMGLALYRMAGAGSAGRLFWTAPLLLFLHVLTQTYSRGGFLALLAGMVILFQTRMGGKKTAVLSAVALPLLFVVAGGRQTNMDASTGSGQSRIQLWAFSLEAFARQPLFGVGQGLLSEVIGQESHNSFIHCFPDIGFFGGACFLGMYTTAIAALVRLGRDRSRIADPELRRLLPYLSAIVAGYSMGMFSISRSYIATTYMITGLIAAYVRLATAGWGAPLERFDARYVGRLVAGAVVFLGVMWLMVPLFTRWG
jgi:O-antigen ligase